MTHALTPMMQQMNDVMGSMRDAMRGEMSHENMMTLSHTMNDMAKELSDMSRAINKGEISDKQMAKMQDRLAEMKTDLDTMQHR
jgi:hypothetical protein